MKSEIIDKHMRSFDLGGMNDPRIDVDDDIMIRRLFELSLESGDYFVQRGLDKDLKPKSDWTAVMRALSDIGYKPVMHEPESCDLDDHGFWYLLKPDAGMVQLKRFNNRSRRHSYWRWTATRIEDEILTRVLGDLMDEVPDRPRRKRSPCIYALVATMGQLQIESLGRVVGLPFEPMNYRPDVAEQFERVAAELEADEPSGRLVLLDGATGLGKTYFIRSLVYRCEDCKFVVITPDALQRLSDPQFLPVLLEEGGGRGNKNLVLVVEDGDFMVRERGADALGAQLNAVSALLNMSDGLLGHALDLRIIATTNTPTDKLDDAIVRRGRMLAHLKFYPLPPEQVRQNLRRLIGDEGGEEAFEKAKQIGTSLSDVYYIARQHGWRPTAAGSSDESLADHLARLGEDDDDED